MAFFHKKNKPHLEIRVKKKSAGELITKQSDGDSDETFIKVMDSYYGNISGDPRYEWCYIIDKKTNEIIKDYL